MRAVTTYAEARLSGVSVGVAEGVLLVVVLVRVVLGVLVGKIVVAGVGMVAPSARATGVAVLLATAGPATNTLSAARQPPATTRRRTRARDMPTSRLSCGLAPELQHQGAPATDAAVRRTRTCSDLGVPVPPKTTGR